MGSGRDITVGQNFTKKLEDATALVLDHLVLSINASNELILCDNVEIPYAIGFRSTKDRRHQTIAETKFNTGAEIGEDIAVFRSGWATIPLDIDHGAIAVGDMMLVGGADIGRVVGEAGTGGGDPTTAADLLRRVGWAEEIIAAPGAGLVTQEACLTCLDMHRGAP